MSIYRELGIALNPILNEIRSKHERLGNLLLKGDQFIDEIIQDYLLGARVGWVTHGLTLRAPTSIPTTQAQEIITQAEKHATIVRTSIETTLNTRGEITKLFAQAYARTLAEQSVWQGQDTTGNTIATLMEANWKEWVRAWPRTHERDHHDALEGVIIPTTDKFRIPFGPNAGALVHGPRAWDDLNAPNEWLNCGHALKFHRTVTRDQLGRTIQGIGTIYEPPTRSAIFAGGTP